MTAVLDAPEAPAPAAGPPRPPVKLPFWLRTPPRRRRPAQPPLTPRDGQWWVGVAWLTLSAILLGFVAHVTLVGSLQHARTQQVLYQELRSELALATAPLGQLDVNGVLVPDGTPIGIISISTAAVQVEEVFVQGTAGGTLVAAPGHRRDSVMPGQEGTSIIMARQAAFGGPFGYLGLLEPGDRIEVTTGQGVSRFEVIGVRREGELLPQPIQAGEGRLELVTADGTPLLPSGVLYVDAQLVGEPKETPAAVMTTEVLRPAEFAMASDPDGLLPTVFWALLLVLAAAASRWVRGKWGPWQTWIVSVPVLLVLGAATSNAAMTLLPNLI